MTNNTQEYENLRRLIFPPEPLSPGGQLRQIFTRAARESGKRSLDTLRKQARREAQNLIRQRIKHRGDVRRNLFPGRERRR